MTRWIPPVVLALLLGPNLPAAEDSAPLPGLGLSQKEAADGFVSLFDGHSLTGWQGATKGYRAENGVLVCLEKGGGNLYTAKQYADFIFRFEFKLQSGGNNGVGLRVPDSRVRTPSQTSMEIQILDDSHPKYKNLHDYQYHGSIYGVVPAKRGHLKPVGQWNREEILCQGYHVKVTLNGAVIVDAYLEKLGFRRLNDKPGDGLKNTKGYLGFLGHGSRVEFRNLRIKEL